MSADYRFEWRWLYMGPLLGYFCGLVVVALTGLCYPPLLLATIPYGFVVGGPIGAGVGLVACLPLAVLVGPHLDILTAERRALALGAAVPTLVLLAVPLTRVTTWLGVGPTPTSAWWFVYLHGATAALGGITAARTARIDMPRTGVS